MSAGLEEGRPPQISPLSFSAASGKGLRLRHGGNLPPPTGSTFLRFRWWGGSQLGPGGVKGSRPKRWGERVPFLEQFTLPLWMQWYRPVLHVHPVGTRFSLFTNFPSFTLPMIWRLRNLPQNSTGKNAKTIHFCTYWCWRWVADKEWFVMIAY